MTRILFVDDEDAVLSGLRNLLRKQRKVWDMAFASSGEEALALAREDPFDVVVSDMRMPGIDGAELLERVKVEWPETVRFILSGHAEPEAAFRAVSVAQQFLNKPCQPGVVEGVIGQALALRALLQNKAVMEVVGAMESLPGVPQVYVELSEVLADETSGVREITEVVSQDLGISTRILQLSNSGFFSPKMPITDLGVAVSRLGSETVRTLALSQELFQNTSIPPGNEGFIEELHTHSMLAANLARVVCPVGGNRDTAFLAGMLHDVGKLVLAAGSPETLAEVQALAEEEDHTPAEAERSIMGISHAEIGAYLLGLWGLPYPVVEAVAHHHDPSRMDVTDPETLLAVHVSDALARNKPEHIDMDFVSGMGLEDALGPWTENAMELVGREAVA